MDMCPGHLDLCEQEKKNLCPYSGDTGIPVSTYLYLFVGNLIYGWI
jgi:hypothetical protein